MGGNLTGLAAPRTCSKSRHGRKAIGGCDTIRKILWLDEKSQKEEGASGMPPTKNVAGRKGQRSTQKMAVARAHQYPIGGRKEPIAEKKKGDLQ